MKRVLVTETDRVGDVISALPVFKTLKKYDNSIYVSALVSPYTKDIFKNFRFVDNIIEYYEKPKSSYENTLFKIKSENFDTAFILHPDYKVAKLIKKALISVRISYGFKLYQYLFTDFLIQHRSKNEKHQVEYNLELLKLAGINDFDTNIKLEPLKEEINFVRNLFSERKIKARKIIGIHPGSGNSSISLPPKQYAHLLKLIKKEFPKVDVVITHTLNDKNVIEEILAEVNFKLNLMPQNLSLSSLIALISMTDLFISNSTGPLHIASALRVPVIGFYSPVWVHSEIRWGPFWGKKLVVKPDVECKQKWKCKKEKCEYYNCFEKIDFSKVLKFISNTI